MTPAPKSISEPSDPEISKEPLKLSSSPQSPVLISNSINGNDAPALPVNGNTVILPVSGDTVILPVNGNNIIYTNNVSESKSKEVESNNIDKDADAAEKEDKSEDEDEISCIIETLAETSLPWRRQTSLPPLPSSVTASLPDDENPLMSEAPSWADNLAYSHLTETGSPYSSPQNTIKCRPPESSHRPVFELFSLTSTQQDEPAVSSIPPPWSCKHSSEDNQDDEPLPSQSVAGSEAGDKASCFLISSHDHVPPSYHSCLLPAVSVLESCSSRRHSDVSSPVHFQFMHKPDMICAAALESELIGIEEDYLHGMADRVSQWLANSTSDNVNDKDFEFVNQEEAERIIESLRQKKKWIMEDTDEGTDADVESDDETNDTKL